MASVNPTTSELGYTPPPPQPNLHLPAGDGRWVIPHYLEFNTFLNFLSRTYYWTHDEALRDSQCNADAMWADLVISTAIRDRQRPVCQLENQFVPRNPTDQAEKDLAEDLFEIFEDFPRFQDAKLALLEAIWLGRSGIQVLTQWPSDFVYPRKRLLIKDWSPVHGDSIVFKFDGTPGILVNNALSGQANIHPIESRGGMVKILTPAEQEVFFCHEFEPMATGFYHHEMAGQVHGSGYRGRVYWYWWLKHNLMRILMDFARKVGNGFFVAGYEAGNRTELAAMQQAMERQSGQPVLYVPITQSRGLDETIEHIQVSMQGADFQWAIIQGLNDLIRSAILGEEGTTRAVSTGLGSNIGSQHGMTADERVKYDATALEWTLQKMVNTICRYCRPGVRPPLFKFLADKREPGEIMECATFYMQAGGVIGKSWVQEQLGIPDPQPGEEVIGMVQPMQATGLTSTPGGVPQSGIPGPNPEMAGQGQATDPEEAQLASQIQPVQMQRKPLHKNWLQGRAKKQSRKQG